MFERIRRKVLRREDLAGLRARHPGRSIVFCSGTYDILQSGHAVFFNQCKDFGDLLVVGVGLDEVVRALKGPTRPVNPERNRLYLVAALGDVDYALLNEADLGPGKIDFGASLEALRPDVFVLNADDSGLEDKRRLCERLGIRFATVERTVPPELEATSSTRIIDKITFCWRAPLRIDFAGGWTDVPYLMGAETGVVANAAIRPLIELRGTQFNFAGYPRGSGLSTSTAAKLLEMIAAPGYGLDRRSLDEVAEDLFTSENHSLTWAIGRQDQYAIVHGGYHCFEFHRDGATALPDAGASDRLEDLRSHLLLFHSGESRSAQAAVEEVYRNHQGGPGRQALATLAACGRDFHRALAAGDWPACGAVMLRNFEAQKVLAPSTSPPALESLHRFALANGAWGGKVCGAGGGGALVFIAPDPALLAQRLVQAFPQGFPLTFEWEPRSVAELNRLQ